jgi:hypothetical protein
MGKVVTERERGGSSMRSEKTGIAIPWKGHEAEYDYPIRKSMSWNRLWVRKEFTDVLSPVKRWLDKQVGRPWNKAYSDLCQVLDKRKLTHKHVFEHVFQYVERDVFRGKDGQWRSVYTFMHSPLVSGLYVNPNTGLLCRQTPVEKVEQKPIDKVKLDENRKYEKKSGIWYICTYRHVDPGAIHHYEWREVAGKMVRKPVLNSRVYGRESEILEHKKQASKKELRTLRDLMERKR